MASSRPSLQALGRALLSSHHLVPTASHDAATPASVIRFLAIAGLGSLGLAVAAHVSVPFWPVPLTLQTLAVLLLGVFAGPQLAAAAVLAYAAEGVAGLPVFAHGAGLATLAGPTGGYIVGFLPAAIVAGFAARARRLPLTLAGLLLADALIFAFGLAGLTLLVGWDKAVAVGLTPFLAGEALKIALATAATRLRPTKARRI
jgi:biotin transport system substrate-specific component